MKRVLMYLGITEDPSGQPRPKAWTRDWWIGVAPFYLLAGVIFVLFIAVMVQLT